MAQDQLYEGFWVEYYDKRFSPELYEKAANHVLSLIKKLVPGASSMLELACGTGNFTTYWQQQYTVKATDLSEDMISRAKKKLPHVNFEIVSMTELREPADSYDIVTCMWESIRYLKSHDELRTLLEKVHEILKEQGLFIFDYHHFPPKNEWCELPTGDWVEVGGMLVRERQRIKTEGDYDLRESTMELQQRDGTTETRTLARSPLLRVPEEEMTSLLEKAGFHIERIGHGFSDGQKESLLFVARAIGS